VTEQTAKMSAEKVVLGFGTEVEECKMSGERLSCLYAEQEKPEPVEMMVLVNKHFKVILCQQLTYPKLLKTY